ncbi:MAG: transglutaminase family protein [Chitinophagaceae bacterium]|nr:transglutaminase family protein [Chitinophagaceae bacterium]
MSVFNIHHITRYEYERPVKESVNEIKIFPLSLPTQQVVEHSLQITGDPEVFLFTDYWGNKVGSFSIAAPHQQLTIESKVLVDTKAFDIKALPNIPMRKVVQEKNNLQHLQLVTISKVKSIDWFNHIHANLYAKDQGIADQIFKYSEYVFNNFRYIKGITTIETTVDELIEQQAGVCQDFSHLLLEMLRRIKIPARYVSGYICPNKNGMRGEGATHAWVEAYLPGYGWAGIDPTNNCWAGSHHVTLATGRDFADCTPVKGLFKGNAKHALSVYVSVGYEDGVVFEEMNNVKMEKIAEGNTTGLFNNFTAQQQ